MGRTFTRQEITELVQTFQDDVVLKSNVIDKHEILHIGINSVRQELETTDGAPSARLRDYARVLKHFIEAPQDGDTIHQANHALDAVSNGQDSTKAIKRSRLWNSRSNQTTVQTT